MNRHAQPRGRRAGSTVLRAAVLMLTLGIAACAGDGDEGVRTRVSAKLDRAADEIRATVAALRPSEAVESLRLVGPEGARLAPLRRTRQESVAATQSNPTVGVQARGGSASGIDPGLSLSFDLFDWSWHTAETRTQRSVTAVFAVPEGYRAKPEVWHVEVVVTDPAGPPRTRRAPITDR